MANMNINRAPLDQSRGSIPPSSPGCSRAPCIQARSAATSRQRQADSGPRDAIQLPRRTSMKNLSFQTSGHQQQRIPQMRYVLVWSFLSLLSAAEFGAEGRFEEPSHWRWKTAWCPPWQGIFLRPRHNATATGIQFSLAPFMDG